MNGGNLYEFDPKYTNFDYGDGNIQQIPRIRVTSPFRLPSQRFFIVQSLGFTIENGQPNTGAPETPSEVVDLAISRDGGETFGSFIRIPMNASGKRKSRFIFQRLGRGIIPGIHRLLKRKLIPRRFFIAGCKTIIVSSRI